MTLELEQFLGQAPLFAGFSETDRSDVASMLRPVRYSAGSVVFREGDLGDSMLLIADGELRLSKRLAGGGEIPLGTLGAGDLTGEMSLVDGSPRSATAVAQTDVAGFSASRKAFNARRLAGVEGVRKMMRQIAVRAGKNLLAMTGRAASSVPVPGNSPVLAQGRPAELPEASILAGLPLIGAHNPEELAPLFAWAQQYELEPGDLLAPVSGRIGYLYLLLYGAVENRVHRHDGADVVEVLAPGSLIGVCSTLSGAILPSTQIALEPAVVVEFSLAQSWRWLNGDQTPDLLFQDLICRQVLYDLRAANRRLAWLKAVETGFIELQG